MICPRCRAENGPGSRFCGQCGAPLPAACPACGAANPPDNRFCGQCASPLRAPASAGDAGTVAGPPQTSPSGEFRQVTVLFCDIVNSTGLAERLGDETLHELLRRFLDAGTAEIFRYGGSVPQFTGDGFMALFGAPVAHEDHVRRALLAAMAILRTVEESPEAPADRPSPRLAIRIGVNSGLVVFGAVSDSVRMDATAIGDTANVAARLQAEAEPNGIVISEATYRLAGGYARVEPIGALRLKGRQEPIAAFRLIDVSSRPHAAADPAAFGSRVFVGRERDMALLEELLHRAEQGIGQAVGIQGEPGIGKSRLLSEFSLVAGQRCTWIEGRCVSYGTAIPYLLALDLLRSACGILDRDRPTEIEPKLRDGLRAAAMDPDADAPLLLALLGGGEAAEAQHGNRPAVKARAFAILRQFAINTSRNRPLVLAIEDAQWIDALSREFLEFLAESLPGARILLVATYRPGYRPAWIGKSYAAQLALQPLTREDSRQVLDAVLNRRRLSDRLAKTLLARAEGNPFFVEQLALNLGEEAGATAPLLPATIRDVVTARIDRLPASTRRLLQVAAVVGREFSLPLIRKVWPGLDGVEPLLRELLQLEFLYERLGAEETTYVFRHALTQDAAYTGLLRRDRRRTHAAVAAALETLYRGRTEEVAELLALHYDRSDESEKAVDYAISAAEKAQRRWANTEALAYFDTALRRLDAMPDTKPNRLRRIDAVIKQAEVKFALGRQTEHIAALDAIRATVEESGEPRYRATWHYWRGFLHSLTDGAPAVAIEHCREAAQIAAAAGFEELDGFIASALAQAYVVAGEPRAAIDVGEKAVRVFEARGNVWWSGRTLGHLANAAVILGEWRRSLEYCQIVMECGNRLSDLRLKAIGWYRMGFAHIQQGDIETGLRCCDEALSLQPTPYDVFLANGYRGYGEIKLGRVESGIARLEAAIAWLRSTRQRYTELRFATWLAEAYLRRGDPAGAMPLIGSVLGGSETNGYRYLAGVGCWLKGISQAAELPEAAAASLDEAIGIFGAIGAQNDLARALLTRAALWERSSHPEPARQMRQQAESVLHALGTRAEPDWFGPQLGAR